MTASFSLGQKGWPTSSDEHLELTQFAVAVAHDARAFTELLASYMVEWMSRVPGMEEKSERYRQWDERFAIVRAAMRIGFPGE